MEFTTHFELHSQATRLNENGSYTNISQAHTGVSPSMLSSSKELYPQHVADHASIDYNSPFIKKGDFKLELFSLHSPLLGESLLVSFPPLSYMLKFSG